MASLIADVSLCTFSGDDKLSLFRRARRRSSSSSRLCRRASRNSRARIRLVETTSLRLSTSSSSSANLALLFRPRIVSFWKEIVCWGEGGGSRPQVLPYVWCRIVISIFVSVAFVCEGIPRQGDGWCRSRGRWLWRERRNRIKCPRTCRTEDELTFPYTISLLHGATARRRSFGDIDFASSIAPRVPDQNLHECD
jgi:hypothetical protein